MTNDDEVASLSNGSFRLTFDPPGHKLFSFDVIFHWAFMFDRNCKAIIFLPTVTAIVFAYLKQNEKLPLAQTLSNAERLDEDANGNSISTFDVSRYNKIIRNVI